VPDGIYGVHAESANADGSRGMPRGRANVCRDMHRELAFARHRDHRFI